MGRRKAPVIHKTDEEIKKAIQDNNGIMTYVALALGLTQKALYARLNNSKELRLALVDARQGIYDEAKQGMMELVKARDPVMIRFALKHFSDGEFSNIKNVQVNNYQFNNYNNNFGKFDLSKASVEDLKFMLEFKKKTYIPDNDLLLQEGNDSNVIDGEFTNEE